MVGEEHLSVAVFQCVRDLVGHPMPVQRDDAEPPMSCGDEQFEVLDPVAAQRGDDRPLADTKCTQRVHDAIGPLVELAPACRRIFVDQSPLAEPSGSMGK